MGSNFQFGGGADRSFMTPVVLAATLLAAVLVLVLPRKYALAPILVITFLTPFGQQLYIGGAHLFVTRILILAGLLRMLVAKLSSPGPLFENPINAFDKAFCLWAFFRAVTFVLLYRAGGAVNNQLSFWLDAYGGYFLFRYLVQNEEDITRAGKALAWVASIMAMCMGYEYLTRVNPFSTIKGAAILPWIRDGKVRAQGVFSNSITAGVFGATLVPLFFWLWKSGKARLGGAAGLAASTLIALTSVASTGLMAFVAGIGALCLWPIRKRMRSIRWGLVLGLAALSLVMHAPVWFIIARADVIGGSNAWDRAMIIDEFVHHAPEWWLLGTKDNASWGDDTWDQCNQFVAEGESGGLVTFVLFILILSRGFGMIGKARKAVEGDRANEWFLWCMGALLFSHLAAFFGIDYFDQIRVWWFLFLAMISAATAPYLTAVVQPAPESELEFAGIGAASTVPPDSGQPGSEWGYWPGG